MYLPQAASLPPSIGAQPDLFRCMHLVWESWFEPTVAASGTVVRPLHAQLKNLHRCAAGGLDLSSPEWALTWWYG